MIGTRFDRVRVLAATEKSMLYSIITPVAVFLLALGASYLINRWIGGLRRHIAAMLISVVLGAVGGLATAMLVVSISAALAGALLGIVLAWRRLDPVVAPARQHERNKSSKRSHYHGERHT
jgi:hypothetical protein